MGSLKVAVTQQKTIYEWLVDEKNGNTKIFVKKLVCFHFKCQNNLSTNKKLHLYLS